MSKYIKKVKPINNITVKISVTADMGTDRGDRLEEQDKIVQKMQRHLISWWKSQTDKSFILVCDYGNLVRNKNTFSYKINLTQLNLKQEEIDRFTQGVKTKVKIFLDDYERDL